MVMFSNKYYLSEKNEDGSYTVTVLEDKYKFFDVDVTGCKLITSSHGLIADEFTDSSYEQMELACGEKALMYDMRHELRCRHLNCLLSYI